MIKMCSFDKSNNSAIVDAFKQPINRREHEKLFTGSLSRKWVPSQRTCFTVSGSPQKAQRLCCLVGSGGAVENGASHVNEYD